MNKLVNNLIQKGYLKTDIIIDAFAEIDRIEFVPDKFRVVAASDMPLSIGHGQVIPEPSVIAFMMELLRPARSQNILVVGFGSGWIVTILSLIVGSNGNVFAIDVIEDLMHDAEKNIGKYNFIKRDDIVELKVVRNCSEMPVNKKYDRIIVINPDMWSICSFRDLLDINGVMVAPIDNIIYYFHNRSEDDNMIEERFESMKFLPI